MSTTRWKDFAGQEDMPDAPPSRGESPPNIKPHKPSLLTQPQDKITAGWQINLTGEESNALRDFIGDEEAIAIVLSWGNGHAGLGLYVWAEDYPEEGSVLIQGATFADAPWIKDANQAFDAEQKKVRT